MRASAASASPKPVLYLFAGLAVLLVTYNLFARPDGTNTSLETPSTAYRPVVGLDADDGPTVNRRVVEAVVKDRPTIAAQPPVVSETAAAPVAAGTAAGAGVAQGMSFEDVSAVRARLTVAIPCGACCMRILAMRRSDVGLRCRRWSKSCRP